MIDRYMRMMLFYDLPSTDPDARREYARFHKDLIRLGFVQMQESVYTKLVLNPTVCQRVTNAVRACHPQEGLVQLLVVTEKQFNRMENILGESTSEVITSDERTVFL